MLVEIVRVICLIFLFSVFARVILSYLSIMPGSSLESFNRVVNAVTDPVLTPVRRVLPPARIGGGALDLSPIVVTVAVIVILSLI